MAIILQKLSKRAHHAKATMPLERVCELMSV